MYRPRSRLEWVVLMTIALAILVGAAVAKSRGQRRYAESGPPHHEERVSSNDLRAYADAFRDWRATHAGERCPTLETLAATAKKPALVDGWGSRYFVVCDDAKIADAKVVSVGRDRKLGTPDDIDASWVDPDKK
jgi:hypothetical protein